MTNTEAPMPFICPQLTYNYVCVPHLPECPAWAYVRYYIAPALKVRIENNTMDIAIKGKKGKVFNYDNRHHLLSDFVDHEGDMLYIYTTGRPWKLIGNASRDARPTNPVCPICFYEFLGNNLEQAAVVLLCHHRVHAQCFKGCVEGGDFSSQRCPLCRMQFDAKHIKKIMDSVSK
jgi:hypothetical protein